MHENSEVIERLEKLERQNRRMKRIGFAVIAGLGATLLMGAAGDNPEVLDEIRVKKLVVEDYAGTVRFLLEGNNDRTMFEMNDVRGNRRIVLFVSEQKRTASFALVQNDGRIRLGSGCTDGGRPGSICSTTADQ